MELSAVIEELGKVTAIAGPIVLSVWQGAKRLHPYTTKRVVDFFVRMDRTMTIVDQQLNPNGGGSMNDRVTKMSSAIDEIGQDTRTLSARQIAIITSRQEPTFEACDAGEFTVVSRSLEEFTGASRDELEGMKWLSAFHPNDQEKLAERYVAAIRDERKFEYVARITRGGSMRLVYIQANRMPDPKNKNITIGWYGVMRDATPIEIAQFAEAL